MKPLDVKASPLVTLSRRSFLKKIKLISSTLLVSTFLYPLRSFAEWLDTAFNADKQDTVIEALWPEQRPTMTDLVQLNIPQFAEDGGVVPIQVACTLENVKSISIIVEKNPAPLSAHFKLSTKSSPYVATQIKMDDSSIVSAIVETPDGLFMAQQEVQVSISGCS